MAIAGANVHRAIRRIRRIDPMLYLPLILLTLSSLTSAQGGNDTDTDRDHDLFLRPIEQTCEYKKAYAVVVKLMAVYASHVLTIRLQPGLGMYQTAVSYVMAALLPAATSVVAVRDLWCRRYGFRDLPSQTGSTTPHARYYRDMQKAINAGAVCVSVDRTLVTVKMRVLDKSYNVRGRPLKDDGSQIFVSVPRGTPAKLFEPTLINGNSQLLKAVLGAIQLALATLQLISSNNPRVAAYGYGSFIYTIIPYAIGSAINVVCAIFTTGYSDITEMVLAPDPLSTDEEERGPFRSLFEGNSLTTLF